MAALISGLGSLPTGPGPVIGGSSTTPFDASQFSEEIQSLNADVGSEIDDTEYTNFIEFLQRLAESGVDVSSDLLFGTAMSDLSAAVSSIATPGGAEFDDEQVTACVQKLVSEGHCNNIFAFLSEMHQQSIDFSSDEELQTTMNNISGEVSQVNASVTHGWVSLDDHKYVCWNHWEISC
jgi:hypothetical protein